MKQKYLVIENTYFYDGHGDVDLGPIRKFISDDDKYKDLNENKFYDKDLQLLEDDYDEHYKSEDGYNLTCTEVQVKKISNEEAERLEHIIREYNKIIINEIDLT